MSKKNKGFARKLGVGLAYFQSTVDNVLHFGFRKLRGFGAKKKRFDTDTVKGKVLHGAKSTASFLGALGESFYEKYNEIKAEKEKKNGENG